MKKFLDQRSEKRFAMPSMLKRRFLKRRFLKRRLLKRREVMSFLGGAVVFSLINRFRIDPLGGQSAPLASADSPAQAAGPTCVVKPEQTEGPYFVDERLNRSDIRSDPADGSIKDGVPLQLVFQVSQVKNGTCTPLSDAIVDIWHCDAEGIYSDVNDPRANTIGKQFLRGYQTTNANGIAQFLTIYPGSYPGRAVHIHFKIRRNTTTQQNHEFTSQLYFDDRLTDRIYRQRPYSAAKQRTLNSQDGIFQDGGEQLTLQLTQSKAGYIGKFQIALK